MRYTISFILICVACAFSQERVIDTIYTDTHKVTYVIDTLNSSAGNTAVPESNSVSKTEEVVDTLGMSAPPNKLNKLSLFLIGQNLSFMLNYEHMLSDFVSIAIRFGYDGFSKKNVHKYTDAEGTINAFEVPLSLKWYWGRRNTGKYHYIDAAGENHYRTSTHRSRPLFTTSTFTEPKATIGNFWTSTKMNSPPISPLALAGTFVTSTLCSAQKSI